MSIFLTSLPTIAEPSAFCRAFEGGWQCEKSVMQCDICKAIQWGSQMANAKVLWQRSMRRKICISRNFFFVFSHCRTHPSGITVPQSQPKAKIVYPRPEIKRVASHAAYARPGDSIDTIVPKIDTFYAFREPQVQCHRFFCGSLSLSIQLIYYKHTSVLSLSSLPPRQCHCVSHMTTKNVPI